MIIGLTGENAAGKGTVARALMDRGFEYRSLSDVIRDELRRQGRPETRDGLTEVGNALRAEGGAGVLAERVLLALAPGARYVIDSIRNPAEVQALRRARGDFRLWFVTADAQVRFERIRARAREGDVLTLEAFERQERREWESPDPGAQQLRATSELADARVDNSGTPDQLDERIGALLDAA